MNDEWRDGFPFVGNHLCLDFLNTRPVIGGEPVELLPDRDSLLRWLVAAGLVSRQKAVHLTRTWPVDCGPELASLREFREILRQTVMALEDGQSPTPGFLSRVNDLLAQHPRLDQVIRAGSGFERTRRFDPSGPEEVFGPLIDDTVDLLTTSDRSRIRKCASCVLHFYDTSKKGSRHWCSMRMCGNRSKVADYSRRKRATT